MTPPGVNRWSAETRTAALLMLGAEPAPLLSHEGRNVLVEGRGNSSLTWCGGCDFIELGVPGNIDVFF